MMLLEVQLFNLFAVKGKKIDIRSSDSKAVSAVRLGLKSHFCSSLAV